MIAFLKKELGVEGIYHWVNNKESFEDFDEILMRGDRNPNTKGLLETLSNEKLSASWTQLESHLKEGKIKTLVVAGPENQKHYPDLAEKIKTIAGPFDESYASIKKWQNAVGSTGNPTHDL